MDLTTMTKWQLYLVKILRKINVCKFLKISLVLWFFQSTLLAKGALNKDSDVWLDGVIPANTCIPPSFQRHMSAQPLSISTKYVCEYMKMDVCKSKKSTKLTSDWSKWSNLQALWKFTHTPCGSHTHTHWERERERPNMYCQCTACTKSF